MSKILKLLLVTLSIFLFSGCGSYVVKNVDIPTENSNLSFKITPTSPTMSAGFSAFILEIQNKTDRDMEIDWNKTSFMKNNQTNGTFMFQGVVFKDRNNPKSNDIIFANSNFTKTIFPNNFVNFDSFNGWSHYGTGLGIQGAYVVIIDNKETIKQKVLVNVEK